MGLAWQRGPGRCFGSTRAVPFPCVLAILALLLHRRGCGLADNRRRSVFESARTPSNTGHVNGTHAMRSRFSGSAAIVFFSDRSEENADNHSEIKSSSPSSRICANQVRQEKFSSWFAQNWRAIKSRRRSDGMHALLHSQKFPFLATKYECTSTTTPTDPTALQRGAHHRCTRSSAGECGGLHAPSLVA